MNKIHNKIKGFSIFSAILAILAFGVITIPSKADAQSYVVGNGTGTGAIGGYVTTVNVTPGPTYTQAPTYVYTAPAVAPTPVVYSSTANKSTVVAKAAPKKTTVAAKPEVSLAASAILGSNSFMPSGLIQWIFFAILLLLVVILVRKIFNADKNYHATPLKHD